MLNRWTAIVIQLNSLSPSRKECEWLEVSYKGSVLTVVLMNERSSSYVQASANGVFRFK